MKMKPLAAMLLSLFTASAFAHSYHDDETPQPPLKQEAAKEPKAPEAKAKPKHTHKPAAKPDAASGAAGDAPASATPAEPKKKP